MKNSTYSDSKTMPLSPPNLPFVQLWETGILISLRFRSAVAKMNNYNTCE